jgi:SAM-dependent methyltransferase
MTQSCLNLIANNQLQLDQLAQLMQKPPLFEPGTPHFWNDPHIAKQMLALHLDPENEAASRLSEVIERSVAWIMETCNLKPGSRVLDLGCGPGLYAQKLAAQGITVTGVDISSNSIDYAREQADQAGLRVEYLCQDFLTINYDGEYDMVMQVYGELCVFSPKQRDDLLRHIREALIPNGQLVFDVSTRVHRARHGAKTRWYAVTGSGFWRPHDHLVLETGFDYPEQSVYCDQYIVIEPDGTLTTYRNWFQDYTLETITTLLETQGFCVKSAWSDLCGTPYDPGTEWIGIIATKGG